MGVAVGIWITRALCFKCRAAKLIDGGGSSSSSCSGGSSDHN